MATLDYFADDRSVPESTLIDLFFEAIDQFEGEVGLQRILADLTVERIEYQEVETLVRHAAGGLRELGLGRGDRVGIISENRPEWATVDYACLCSGIVGVPIYPSLMPPQIRYLLEDAEVGVVFASTPELAAKVLEAQASMDKDVRVIAFDGAEGATPWTEFMKAGAAAAQSPVSFREEARRARPEDLATLIYTSGTTGDPKGVMLTHNNLASDVRAAGMALEVYPTDSTVSFLPLSHVLQRMVDYLLFWKGCTIGYPRSIQTVIADLKVLQPTIVVSVPRIYEKIYNNVMDAEGLKKRLVNWAVGVADRVATIRLDGGEPKGLLALQYAVADRLVFSKVKAAVGGRLRFFVSGGGPLAPTLNRFFYSIGMVVLEGYGLTETSPVTNVNTMERFRIGTVGPPVPGTEIRIAEDGEILIRGPQVMKGYYKKPEATAEVIDADGWFATGDVGEIDADGMLRITDRKKDLIVTAGGKNVAPQPIENRLKTHPLVEQAVLVGDRRRFCALLVVPAFEILQRWADKEGLGLSGPEALVGDARVQAHVEAELLGMLSDLASYERPKRVALLPEEFTVENGFLTPSMKVKRRVVREKLGHVIDGLYEK